LSEKERLRYRNVKVNREAIVGYADRLLVAEALVLVYPIWNEGFPAILTGFFGSHFIPG
jgi:NAD(P)H dehydrogenase (quinone)